MDTIFALASGAGRAGIAIIRLSGPRTADILLDVTGKPPGVPRMADRRTFFDTKNGEAVDDGLVLWFPGPNSYTGEDLAELHIHGGAATIAAILSLLDRFDDARMAEPGEFTRRAFSNGKMDLTAVEGLADLIDAETEAQRKQALRQAEGVLGSLYDSWADRLTRALAYMEAAIDFAEEALPEDIQDRNEINIRELIETISQHIDMSRSAERIRDGIRIAIVGRPNAGKSSLLNRLAGRSAAIVSDIAGTTRDVIEVRMDLGGYPVTLMDTAGLRETGDVVEGEGVRRAVDQANQADLVLHLLDGTVENDRGEHVWDSETITVVNKQDRMTTTPEGLSISATSGAGVDELIDSLTERVHSKVRLASSAVATRARHRSALEECRAALIRSLDAPDVGAMAEDMRMAVRALGRITGRVDVEDLLDVIFSDFCIGK